MSARPASIHVPDHLIGTRQGLFHLLRETNLVPNEDPMARAKLLKPEHFGDIILQAGMPVKVDHFSTKEQNDGTSLIYQDEFYFRR